MSSVAFSYLACIFYPSCISMLQHMTPLTSSPEKFMDRNDSCNIRAVSTATDVIDMNVSDFADVCKLEGQAAES